MNLIKLFESLDEKVFTTELKESLTVQFNEAVELKANEVALERIEEEIDSLSEKSEEHIKLLKEESDADLEATKTELLDSIDKYLERVVEEFVTEAKESLDESIKSEKTDLIIEAFDTMLIAAGVEVSKIVEAKEDESTTSELEESIAKYDTLVDENISLKEENDNLIKMGIVQEIKGGLSIVESEKFEKLAELVEFSKDSDYLEKLETIKESVKTSKSEDNLNEDKNEDNGEVPIWNHLI
jgi:hypothetical protein